MGVGYQLINQTKKERIAFAHLAINTKREIAGDPVPAALVSWYLIENQGDEIQFVSDTYDDWPFKSGSRNDIGNYPDRTDQVVDALIKAGILRDDGIDYADELEPETIYVRAITNIWMD